jgi:hypothetical protein
MWSLVAIVLLAGLLGIAARCRPAVAHAREPAPCGERALNLAVYRALVLKEVASRPGMSGSIPASALPLPAWYRLDPDWRNVVLPGGIVAVYASRASSPGLLRDLLDLTGHSAQVGQVVAMRRGTATLHLPRTGNTGLQLPGVPCDTVVWLALWA